MGKLLERHQLGKTILQRRKQGLLGSRETKDSNELESKKKSTLVQDRRRQNDQRRGPTDGRSGLHRGLETKKKDHRKKSFTAEK